MRLSKYVKTTGTHEYVSSTGELPLATWLAYILQMTGRLYSKEPLGRGDRRAAMSAPILTCNHRGRGMGLNLIKTRVGNSNATGVFCLCRYYALLVEPRKRGFHYVVPIPLGNGMNIPNHSHRYRI